MKIMDIEKSLDAITSAIRKIVSSGEYVKIRNFGTFKMVNCKGKKIHDISCGQMKDIPEYKNVRFIASDEFLNPAIK